MDVGGGGGVYSNIISPTFTSRNPLLDASGDVTIRRPLPPLFKRSAPTSDPAEDGEGEESARFPAASSARLPGHRRLSARATVRTTPRSMRNGSHVFRKPAQLTCFPWTRTRRQSFTMFHEVLFS